MRLLLKVLNWIANTFPFLTSIAPMRVISFILFIVAWSTSQVSGWMAWAILFLIMDLKFDIKRN
jgi:hypothetical protein